MPTKNKLRRQYWKTRRRPKSGLVCNCYYCLRKIERKRAGTMNHKKNR